MDKKRLNGNGKPQRKIDFDQQEIEFPVTYPLKAVMTVAENDDDNKHKLVSAFLKHNINYRFGNKTTSKKGSYVSYTYVVTITSKKQMDELYDELKNIKELKFAV